MLWKFGLLILVVISGPNASAGAQDRCLKDLLSNLNYSWKEHPGTDAARKEVLDRWDSLPGETRTRSFAGTQTYQIARYEAQDSKQVLGYVNYHIRNGDTLFIEMIRVSEDENLTRKGLSTYLIANALRSHPRVSRVEAMLSIDNYAAFLEAYENTSPYLQKTQKNATIERAIEKTPLYRSLQRLGFNDVVDWRWSGKHGELWAIFEQE